MSFSTKKYTRPVLVSELRKLNSNQFSSLSTFTNAFSPRAGSRSAKVSALRSVLGRNISLRNIFTSLSGSEAKSTLISLVKNA